MEYEKEIILHSKLFKALADPKRLQVIMMLSCGEMCACQLLEAFEITQPTLSHDMRVLQDAGLVSSRREGKWIYYTLRTDTFESLMDYLHTISKHDEDGICNDLKVERTTGRGCVYER